MTSARALKQLAVLKRLGGTMRLAAEGWGEEWQTLVAIILSARTRDETTTRVGERLFKKFRTVHALARATAREVSFVIQPVNFYHNKTKNIINCTRVLDTHFGGLPPHDISSLLTLPGVGRKTANVFLASVGHDAIGVDTHVSYISRSLGWTQHTNPNKIEKDLEKLFPKTRWRKLNTICVQFGKKYKGRKKKNELLSQIRAR